MSPPFPTISYRDDKRGGITAQFLHCFRLTFNIGFLRQKILYNIFPYFSSPILIKPIFHAAFGCVFFYVQNCSLGPFQIPEYNRLRSHICVNAIELPRYRHSFFVFYAKLHKKISFYLGKYSLYLQKIVCYNGCRI